MVGLVHGRPWGDNNEQNNGAGKDEQGIEEESALKSGFFGLFV